MHGVLTDGHLPGRSSLLVGGQQGDPRVAEVNFLPMLPLFLSSRIHAHESLSDSHPYHFLTGGEGETELGDAEEVIF